MEQISVLNKLKGYDVNQIDQTKPSVELNSVWEHLIKNINYLIN